MQIQAPRFFDEGGHSFEAVDAIPVGKLCVHQSIEAEDFWRVTHTKSGMAFTCTFTSKDAALGVAVQCDALGDWDASASSIAAGETPYLLRQVRDIVLESGAETHTSCDAKRTAERTYLRSTMGVGGRTMSTEHKSRIAAVTKAIKSETNINNRINLVCEKLSMNGYGKTE